MKENDETSRKTKTSARSRRSSRPVRLTPLQKLQVSGYRGNPRWSLGDTGTRGARRRGE